MGAGSPGLGGRGESSVCAEPQPQLTRRKSQSLPWQPGFSPHVLLSPCFLPHPTPTGFLALLALSPQTCSITCKAPPDTPAPRL